MLDQLRITMIKQTMLQGLLMVATIMLFGCQSEPKQKEKVWKLEVTENGRYFQTADGEPFFWLGETGWLLFSKLTREEADQYLTTRQQQGFNVIQAMILHTLNVANVYGDTALINNNVAMPRTTEGKNPADSMAYDYWDHLDYVIDLAAKKGIYMALVPVWGGNAKGGKIDTSQATAYGKFLAERFGTKPNIIWLNGGDISGAEAQNVWLALGSSIRKHDPNHLMTFHPRGRMTSSQWFHNEPWLDFNMFQSGHKSYAQDTMLKDWRFGEDNWRYVKMDYALTPAKPTFDGEPSYEEIPHGLHDTTGPYWTADDVRRYAYWSVLAGAAGYTYGHNAVMQMNRPGDTDLSFGPRSFWYDGIHHDGAKQMVHLKTLVNSVAFYTGQPDTTVIMTQGTKYDFQPALRGDNFIMIYTYNGRDILVNFKFLSKGPLKASWFNPRKGDFTDVAEEKNLQGIYFNPPGEKKDGNDWVLVLKWKND